jgi:hypothetical protein
MTLHVRLFAVASFAAVTLGAAPLAAQSRGLSDTRNESPTAAALGVAPAAVTDSVVKTPRGPSIASERVASHAITTPRGAPPVIQNRTSNRNAVALMIVGGAALVVGAVIGNDAGTLVMLGGAGIGLYGLYLFLT